MTVATKVVASNSNPMASDVSNMKINETSFGCQGSLFIPEEPLLLSPSLSLYWEVKLQRKKK